jgi:hypothetical protein
MARDFCLTRRCLGVTVRIEAVLLPLAGERGLWTLICIAGLSPEQPSQVKAQGPFRWMQMAESILDQMAESLRKQGYTDCSELPIWSLHARAEVRRLNAQRQASVPGSIFRTDV